jgi:hypothetical protein
VKLAVETAATHAILMQRFGADSLLKTIPPGRYTTIDCAIELKDGLVWYLSHRTRP